MKAFKKISAVLLALAMVLSMVPLSVLAVDYPTITVGEEVTVTLDGTTVTSMTYSFTPTETDKYMFYSYDHDFDTYGYIKDAEGNTLERDDDSGEGANFLVIYELTAGTTYLLEARFCTTSNAGSMKVKVEQVPAPTAITLNPSGDYTEGLLGGRYFYVSFEPQGAEDTVSYSTDHPDILKVREDGYVCGTAPGTATVTATTGGGLTASITVTVSDAIDMALDTEYTVSPATCRTGSFRFTPAETGMYRFYSYDASANTYYRIYDAQGNLLYHGGAGWPNEFSADYELTAGQTYYCTAYNGSDSSFDSFKVKMVKLTSATGMTLDPSSVSSYAANAIWLNPVFAPDNAIQESVSWVSSDPTVATVNSIGKVVLLSVGTTTITATSESGFTATCAVTVLPYPTISCCNTVTAAIDYAGTGAWYAFTPTVDGTYAFYSDADYDTKGYIFDSTGTTELAYDDDGGRGNNFMVCYTMTAGTTYLLKAMYYSDDRTGSFEATLMKVRETDTLGHEAGEYTCTDTEHGGTCILCGESFTEAHTYDENYACFCGYVHSSHTGSVYYRDETNHGFACTICGDYVEEEHSFDADGNCVCAYFIHDHEYPAWDWNEDVHYEYCRICDIYAEESHVFDETGVCVCGYFEHTHQCSDMGYNSERHWGICELCNMYVTDIHCFGPESTCVCGYFLHEHDSNGMDYDTAEHWSVCSQCGLTTDETVYGDHVYDDQGKCQDCEREKIVGVTFGDILLDNGQYLDNSGNITTEAPAEGGYACVKDGVLTLHDFRYVGIDGAPFDNAYGLYAERNLVLVLEGRNKIHCTNDDGIYIAGANLTIRGDGMLEVIADGDYDGIDVDGGKLTIEGGTLFVDGSDHGIEVYGDLQIDGGIVIIEAADDGMDINGDITINGGIFNINAEDHGIDGYKDITINGGDFYIETNDDNGFDADDGDITVNGGSFEFDTNDECFSAEGTVTINGGKFVFDAGSTDAAIQSGTGIVFGEAMGEQPTIVDEYGYTVLADAEGNLVSDMVLVPVGAGDEIAIEYHWINLSDNILYSTGEKYKPTIKITDDDGNTLVAGEDYTLTWSAESIKELGLYTVIVEGIGQYRAKHVLAVRVERCQVYVGGQLLSFGEYIDNAGNITTEKPQGGYAYLYGNVLELNNYSYEGAGTLIDHGFFTWNYAIYAMNDLEIVLVGRNSVINTNEAHEGDAIGGPRSLTISGQGSLTVQGEWGIYTEETVTIESGSLNIDAANTGIYAYDIFINCGRLEINGGQYGLYAKNGIDFNCDIANISGNCGVYSYYWIEFAGGVVKIDGETIGVETYYLDVYNGYMEVLHGGVWVKESLWMADNVSVTTPEGFTYVEDTLNDSTYYCVIGDAEGNVADHVVIQGMDTQNIKWQLKAGTTAEDATTDLRLISWVDTLEDYSKVTFTVSFFDVNGNPISRELACTNAYVDLKANGSSVGPASNLFGENANYYVTYVIQGWPQMYFDTPVSITVTWYDLDGWAIRSSNRVITLSDGM